MVRDSPEKYSSARNYVYGDHTVIEVETSYAGMYIP